MSGDTLVYEMSTQSEGAPSIFVKKDWLNILDTQNGNYSGNQCVIETSQLANSNKYMNYREAYLAVPMILTATGATIPAPATAATSVDYAFGLKNWFGSIIHSLTLELGGTTIIQQTPYAGLWNSFKLMTSLSWQDVQTQGASIGFYPDNALSCAFTAAGTTDGLGTCNNRNLVAFPTVSGALNSFDTGNAGFLKRQQYINYDPEGLTDVGDDAYSTLLTSASCNALYKSYVFNKVNAATGVFQIAIMGMIELKHLHSFFQNVPLLKGIFMKATLNLNQPQITSTLSAGKVPAVQVTSPLGGVNPVMIASATASNGGAVQVASQTTLVSLFVGNRCLWGTQTSIAGVSNSPFSNVVSLYVPAYVMNPVYEQAYLSSPVKRIVYTDIYNYVVNNVAPGATFNNLVTSGISGLKSVLVLPYYTATANGGVSPIQSPFDPAGAGPTSPLCLLNNFNVVVSGQNMIYNTQRYSYEQFMNNLAGCNAVNAGLTDGITSSLIGQLDFEMEYCYHYVNCSRVLPIEEQVSKSITVIGQNQSAKAVDLYVFAEYGVEIKIDVLSGNRVSG